MYLNLYFKFVVLFISVKFISASNNVDQLNALIQHEEWKFHQELKYPKCDRPDDIDIVELFSSSITEENLNNKLRQFHLLLSSRYALLLLEIYIYLNDIWKIYEENKNEIDSEYFKTEFFNALLENKNEIDSEYFKTKFFNALLENKKEIDSDYFKTEFFNALLECKQVLLDMQKSLYYFYELRTSNQSFLYKTELTKNDVQETISIFLRLIENKNHSISCINNELDIAYKLLKKFLEKHYKILPSFATNAIYRLTGSLLTKTHKGSKNVKDKIIKINILIQLHVIYIKNIIIDYGFEFQKNDSADN